MFFDKYQLDIASCTDDNIHHTSGSDLYIVLSKLENCANSLFVWFKGNHMQPNGDHCVESIRIRNYSGPYFPAFGLNTERFSPNAGKYGPE